MARVSRRKQIAAAQGVPVDELPKAAALRIFRTALYVRLSIMDTRDRKRDNNNVYDFLDSDGYVRLKADLSASSKELYEVYQIYCTENNLPALKPRSFSEALIACQSRYNLEYCNNVTNAAGRRVRGFLGIEVLVRNHISVFSGDSMRTYVPEDVPEEWRH